MDEDFVFWSKQRNLSFFVITLDLSLGHKK